MPQAVLPLLMNMMVAIMFVAGFMAVAHAHPIVSRARWFAVCFLFGIAEPLANLSVWFGVPPQPARLVGFTTFLIALIGLSLALSHFHGRKPMWRIATAIVLAGFTYRLVTLGVPRDEPWNEFLFQGWYALASAMCAYTVRMHAARTPLNSLLFVLFLVSMVHFPLKAVASVMLGNGHTEHDYVFTLYAVLSQTSSGVLMIAVALLILIGFLQTVLRNTQQQANSDALTGLPNRRAMDEWFDALANCEEPHEPVTVAVIDVDRFKQFNDRFGHDVGDEVLRAVATSLDRNRPSAARLARLGGEEFVALLPKEQTGALHSCESMRLAISRLTFAESEPVTVSIGLSQAMPGEPMGSALRRADQALYRAKARGRNRCEVAAPDEGEAPAASRSRASGPELKLVKHG
ncbi:GGDEF domain-containing protein [Alteriqipengyuania sp. 357]